MASKRQLKRELISIVSQLYNEALLLHQLSTPETQESLSSLMDDLLVFTDDTLRQIQNPDGKDNPKLIKAYYQRVRAHIATQEEQFNDRLTLALEQV